MTTNALQHALLTPLATVAGGLCALRPSARLQRAAGFGAGDLPLREKALAA